MMGTVECSAESLATVLDTLDVLVYVSDMRTNELLFLNAYGRRHWGEPAGRKCWEVLQTDQAGPCSFCTNKQLIDEHGRPGPVVVWEFCNTHNGHWYQCRDQAVPWTDGRLVRLEVATDITEQKRLQSELVAAHAHAELQAHTDQLTGLANRRAYFERNPLSSSGAQQATQPAAVILFDLDNFKVINDSYGHAAGDAVLVEVARLLQVSMRDGDIACRFGGEEFSISLTDVDIDRASAIAERLRTTLEATKILFDNGAGEQVITVTASFGVAADASGRLSLNELLAKADAALYRAKNLGRNRVERSD
jgi:diguanylate cyclase (GGDEF)-like protein